MSSLPPAPIHDESPVGTEPTSPEQRDHVVGPVLTWAVCGLCILIFFSSASLKEPYTWESLGRLGYFPASKIWGGEYWGLWTSVFVHLALWHLVFNLLWLWSLGRSLELAAGRAIWILLFLVSAGISSSAQLAVSSDTGIGASGVVYAFFGFAWAARHRLTLFDEAVGRRNGWLLLGWLVLCVPLSYFGVLQVGNAAHVAGILTGFLIGHALYGAGRRSLSWAAVVVLLVLVSIPLFWAPWSTPWIENKVDRAYDEERYADAIDWLNTLVERDPRNAWAIYNRGVVLRHLGNKDEATRDIGYAISLDPNIEAFAIGDADPNSPDLSASP